MKKRILSFFLAIISTFSLVVPVFATNTQLSNNPDKVISTIDYAVTIDECTIDDDNIYIRALSGTDVAERIGNVIYLNGVKEATISDTIDINNSETVMPKKNRKLYRKSTKPYYCCTIPTCNGCIRSSDLDH